jgi:post-segregation antitoxin (ccd killing protein)
VLITDGKATCDQDPEEALAELRDAGIEVSLNIVGFALDDEAVKEQMRAWAEANLGNFYDATDADSLTEAVKVAVAAPVDIYAVGDDAAPVASTTVGAPPVELPPGEYRVVVLSDPAREFGDVFLGGGEAVSLELPVEPRE